MNYIPIHRDSEMCHRQTLYLMEILSRIPECYHYGILIAYEHLLDDELNQILFKVVN